MWGITFWATLVYYIHSHLKGILQCKYLKLIYNKTYHLLYPNTTIKKKWKSWKKKRVRINKKLLCKFEIFTVVWGFWSSGISCCVTGQVVSITLKEHNGFPSSTIQVPWRSNKASHPRRLESKEWEAIQQNYILH